MFIKTIFCLIIVSFFTTTVLAETPQSDLSNDTQQKIQNIFNNLESVGTASNNGGTAAKQALFDIACRESSTYVQDLSLWKGKEDWIIKSSSVPGSVKNWVLTKLASGGEQALQFACAALQGQKVSTGINDEAALSLWQGDILPQVIEWSEHNLNNSKLPFLSRIDMTAGGTRGGLFSSVTTIEPLWQSESDRDHFFTQISWYAVPDENTNKGYKKKYDTFNAGLVYRTLSPDENMLYGANFFLDYAPGGDHWRGSVGVDTQSSQWGVSVNRYFPLSSWQQLDDYYEERVSAGWDMQVRGQTSDLPSWTGLVTGYQWDDQESGHDQYGIETGLEYSPIPALAVRMAINEDNQNAPSFESALRFTWRFNEPADLQLRPRTELTPVKDRIYNKVQRDNIIRVSQRRRIQSEMTVIETVGLNTITQSSETVSLSAGQLLWMPATITVANTGGAIVRVRLSDGSILSAGQNTQVRVEPRIITLISGTIQFTSNGIISTINTPGSVITLRGTDLDVTSDGTNSTTRLRDGSIAVVGTATGSVTLSPGQAAESTSGSVAIIGVGTADYISHTDQVSALIDRIGTAQTGNHVTPYPSESPLIATENLTVGQDITFRLRYNDAVDVTGTPRLTMTINGNSRTANYLSGSGTTDLLFSYTLVMGDIGVSSILITGLDLNGGTVSGNGKAAVTTIADKTLTLSGSLTSGDVVAPSGYTVAFTTDPINNANKSSGAFSFAGAEVGATYAYTISSSGGGTNVTGSGTIVTATDAITGLNLTGLSDSTLTLSVTLTDTSGNAGSAATDTVTKDIVAPTISSVTAPPNSTYEP